MSFQQHPASNFKINPSFIKEYNRQDAGNWQFDLIDKKLFWSGRQFEIYGFKPGSVAINPEFFIARTTHHTEIDRVNAVINKAILSENEYSFRRRIIKNDGRIGFVETQAQIFRDNIGKPVKIIGLTIDLGGNEAKGTLEYNDPSFFNDLYTNYKKTISFEIYKFVFDEEVAEDLCQEVFVKAWNNILKYDPQKGKIYTWLINIARNHCKDYLKSKYFQNNKGNIKIEMGDGQLYNDFYTDNNSVELTDLLKRLPPDLSEITQLLYLQGYTQEEVAKIKHLPLGTVKTRSRKAISYLRTALIAN